MGVQGNGIAAVDLPAGERPDVAVTPRWRHLDPARV